LEAQKRPTPKVNPREKGRLHTTLEEKGKSPNIGSLMKGTLKGKKRGPKNWGA